MSEAPDGAAGLRLGCAALSRDAGEDLAGTASTVRRWLLVEQPGPWGADAPRDSRMDAAVAEGLERIGRATGARVLLIRRCRPDADASERTRTAFAAHTCPMGRWIERVVFDDPAELLERDWHGLTANASVGGARITEPLFLVCTNGRHDACCAELGRPFARALSALEPTATWESSHFGGDRFAGNLVCLPEGLYYGRLEPGQAAEVAAAQRQGRVLLEHLRGRSSAPFGVQAAEIALRRRTGLTGIDDLVESRRERLGGGELFVEFRDRAGRVHPVAVRPRRDTAGRMLSCGAEPATPVRYETEILQARSTPSGRVRASRSGGSGVDTEHSDEAALQAARAQRADLWRHFVALERALAGPVPGRAAAWGAGVHDALVDLAATFERHIAVTQGTGGLFAEVLDSAPRVEGAVERLCKEHEEISSTIGEELRATRTISDSDAEGFDRALDARGRLTSLLAKLSRHRQAGADLVYEAYAVDIGVGD